MTTPTEEWNTDFLPQSITDCLSPHEFNLNLLNFDKVDASNCPYVLTSPRSLEACANQGVKPVELLPKAFEEFHEELPPNTPFEEVKRLYKQFEHTRTRKLEKCRKEREYIIRVEKVRHRSKSLSPKGRRTQILEEPQLEVVLSSDEDQCASVTMEDSVTPTPQEASSIGLDSQDATDLSSTTTRGGGGDSSEDSSLAPAPDKPSSKSTPTSPFHRPTQLMHITSPFLKAKLVDNPKIKTKLPAKDIKLLELMLKRREEELKDEDQRCRAHCAWEQEREFLTQRKVVTTQLRRSSSAKRGNPHWRHSQPPTPSSSEIADSESSVASKTPEEKVSAHVMSHLADMQHCLEQASERQAEHAKRLFQQQREEEEAQRQRQMEREEAYRRHLELRIQQKEAKFAERRKQMSREKESTLRKSAEELEEKMEQVRLNQREMDHALDLWRQRVADYQEATNLRAQQRAQEAMLYRRRRAQQERMLREAEHQKNLQRVEGEESRRLRSMMDRLKEKEEKSRLLAHEKQLSIEQSRALARASADLREHLRHRVEQDLYLRRPRSNMSTPSSSSICSCLMKRAKSNEEILK
ncbi:coiled-coil domain-containing protein 177-like [Ornithodoros turicata]|uniref:coiled-coil domain-containing protein 177-like n=1 Tax=Ornithodoros turicata TaxID=34597 RepID=UPI00313974D1